MSEKMELADRKDFIAAHARTLDLTEISGSWGQPRFIHGHVQTFWEGWRDGRATLRASSPAQEPVTTEPDDIVWSRVNSEPFEYAIQQGPHGDEFVKLINGKCLKRSCAPLLAISAPPRPGWEWQSIETAPRDGTWVLSTTLGNNPYTHQPFVPDTVQWAGSRWNNGLSDHGYQPTHWMPLPAPPDGDPK